MSKSKSLSFPNRTNHTLVTSYKIDPDLLLKTIKNWKNDGLRFLAFLKGEYNLEGEDYRELLDDDEIFDRFTRSSD